MLRGEAWAATEHISLVPGEVGGLAHEAGMTVLWAALDEAFKNTDDTEKIKACEKLLYGSRRMTSPAETMQNYISRFRQAVRQGEKNGIKIPDLLQAFLLLRKS